MSIAVTELTMERYDAVLDLWENCEGIGLSSADEPESMAAYLERNPGMSFVALDGEKVVGAVLSGHDGRRGYLHHLAVREDFRGRGVGRRLVQSCLDALGAAGIRKCHLFLFSDNEDGLGFWTRIGWTPRKDIGVVSRNL